MLFYFFVNAEWHWCNSLKSCSCVVIYIIMPYLNIYKNSVGTWLFNGRAAICCLLFQLAKTYCRKYYTVHKLMCNKYSILWLIKFTRHEIPLQCLRTNSLATFWVYRRRGKKF